MSFERRRINSRDHLTYLKVENNAQMRKRSLARVNEITSRRDKTKVIRFNLFLLRFEITVRRDPSHETV